MAITKAYNKFYDILHKSMINQFGNKGATKTLLEDNTYKLALFRMVLDIFNDELKNTLLKSDYMKIITEEIALFSDCDVKTI